MFCGLVQSFVGFFLAVKGAVSLVGDDQGNGIDLAWAVGDRFRVPFVSHP